MYNTCGIIYFRFFEVFTTRYYLYVRFIYSLSYSSPPTDPLRDKFKPSYLIHLYFCFSCYAHGLHP